MKKWVSKYKLIHHKPVREDRNAPDNNGWFYTAFWELLGHFPLASSDYYNEFSQLCYDGFKYERIPFRNDPPFSRDEAIGMNFLTTDKTFYNRLSYNWFYYDSRFLKNYSKLKGIYWILKSINKKNNWLWKTARFEAYQFLFKVNLADRYYFKKTNSEKPTFTEIIAWFLYVNFTIWKNDRSEINVLTVQLLHLGYYETLKRINIKKNLQRYFPEGHPIIDIHQDIQT